MHKIPGMNLCDFYTKFSYFNTRILLECHIQIQFSCPLSCVKLFIWSKVTEKALVDRHDMESVYPLIQ